MKKNNKETKSDLFGGIILGACLALCFIIPQTAKNIQYYNEYNKAVEKGYETVTYDSFWDFIQNWDGDIAHE